MYIRYVCACVYVYLNFTRLALKLTPSEKVVQRAKKKREGEKEGEEGLIKIARHPTMFREDNIFPPRAKITRSGGMKIENKRRFGGVCSRRKKRRWRRRWRRLTRNRAQQTKRASVVVRVGVVVRINELMESRTVSLLSGRSEKLSLITSRRSVATPALNTSTYRRKSISS